jgi:hypothetical protein
MKERQEILHRVHAIRSSTLCPPEVPGGMAVYIPLLLTGTSVISIVHNISVLIFKSASAAANILVWK